MKKFYKENRVFVILMGIALVCIGIIIAIFANYIINSTSADKYGNRLDGISDVSITKEKITEMEEAVLEMAKVEDATINIHGKIVNFVVQVATDTTIEESKNIGISSLEFFTEDYHNFYDLQFIITKTINVESTEEDEGGESGFTIIGYKKAGSTTITWSNNAKN